MDADPARRYASAADLARDLENVLEQRPIEARRAGAWLRARRWVQRNPTTAVSALAGVLVLFVGPTVFAVQQLRARDRLQLALDETEAERKRATQLAGELRVQRDEAQAQSARAEQNLDAALSAVDVMLTRVGDRELRQVPRMDEVRRGLLEDALAFYTDLLAQRAGEATSLDELELRLTLAKLEMDFGEDVAAEARLADLLERIERAAEAGLPEDALTYLNGRVLNTIAGLHYGIAQSPEALEEFRVATRVLQECAMGPKAGSEERINAAIALANLGLAMWQAERPREQVLEAYDAARELRSQLLDQDSELVNQQVELAWVDGMRARCLIALKRLDESHLAVEQAVQGLRTVLEHPPAGRAVRSRIVATANGLSWSLDHRGDVDQAVAMLAEVLPVSDALVRDFPEIDEYFQDGTVLAIALAGGLSDNPDGDPPDPGRLVQARDLLLQRLDAMERRVECRNEVAGLFLMAASARTNLAEVLLDLGDPAAAMLEVERSVAELQVQSQAGAAGTARRELSRSLGSALVVRAAVLAHDGAHERARDDLTRAEPSQAGDARSEFELAKAWMLCGAAVEGDAALSLDALAALLDACYGKSLAALERAADAGWTNAAPLRKDELWEALRGLPEFDALLERLAPRR
jgi:tetratricopeptide (TPR) repeat protein